MHLVFSNCYTTGQSVRYTAVSEGGGDNPYRVRVAQDGVDLVNQIRTKGYQLTRAEIIVSGQSSLFGKRLLCEL